MTKDNPEFKKDVAFINREKDLKYLRDYINIRPESILFIHGPKSSGKTTLMYKFIDQIQKEQKMDVKFLNLRKIFTEFNDDYNYKDFLNVFFQVEDKGEKTGKLSAGINVGFFKIDSEIEKKMKKGKVDPFRVMEREFIRQNQKGIKPILIIDELQALDKIYLDNGRDRRLIVELFNFFVAMTKESHLAHIMIASSDGYFINTVYNDSRLKKTSEFYKVDYLPKEDVMEWLLNLEKYSRIKEYSLSREDAANIWDTVGGSMWEIQHILNERFNNPLEPILTLYKKKMTGIIAHYTEFDNNKKQVLQVVNKKDILRSTDLENLPIKVNEIKELLRDMVRNNILYFDPTEAIYYPQGKSYRWGIKLFFEGST
jgi:AAA+ ATPase superfamily predicted ATPase